jgi:hypothetical protein
MKPPLHRCIVASLYRSYDSLMQRFNDLTILAFVLLLPLAARAQFSPAEAVSASSTSGQFIVTGGQAFSRLASLPVIVANTNLVRLEPALLAVSAERLKESLRLQLGISRSAAWSGKIFLSLHPAQSPDENITIITSRFLNRWNYRVELPDVVSRARLSRALTAALLLEFANRGAQSRSTEIPAWLTDGLSQQLSTAGATQNILSLPNKIVNDIAVANIDATLRGLDPMAGAREALKNSPALTFDQLSWPTDAQLSGVDCGAYRASAQLFVSSLLGLQDGPAHLRTMLQNLPQYYNWQTAFLNAFSDRFSRPLDVEKWWALQVVDFAAQSPGPQWSPAASRDRLNEILSVPVELRNASNSLPSRAEISLQAVIRNFDFAQQAPVLQTRLRDLSLAKFRMAAPLAALTDAYRRVIQDYLEMNNSSAPLSARHAPSSQNRGADVAQKKLNALDTQRRAIEDSIKPDDLRPQDLNASAP